MAELGVGDKAVTVILTGDRRLRASSGSGGGRMRPPTSSPFPTTNPGTPSCPRTWGTFGSAGHRQEAGRGPGGPLEEEVLVLAAHGLWHLLGHDHQKEEEWEGFRRVQERILAL